MKITTLVALVNIAMWVSVAVAVIFAIVTLHTAKPLWAFLIPAFSMLTFQKEGSEGAVSQSDNKEQDDGLKEGHWIHRNDDHNDWLECSECGYGDEGEVKFGEETDYCPHCGAKMNGQVRSDQSRV